MPLLKCFVPGADVIVGKQRPRVVQDKGKGKHANSSGIHTYTPEKTVKAEEIIAWEWRKENQERGLVLWGNGEPIKVTITAWMHRGKTVKRAKPTVAPDIDNVAKLVCDALNKVAYWDDKQVVILNAEKRYCEPPQRVGLGIVVEDAEPELLEVEAAMVRGERVRLVERPRPSSVLARCQRASAADFAIDRRASSLSASALALPPLARPSVMAIASLPRMLAVRCLHYLWP